MNIIEALTDHNTIAREVWPAGEYVLVETNDLRMFTLDTPRLGFPFCPTLADLLADDWHPVA